MSLAENTFMIQESSSYFDFDLVAGRYDKWYDSARGAIYDRLEKQVIDGYLKDITIPARLLEVGCGTGHFSKYFSDRGFIITGVDISSEMIRIARQKQIPNSHFEIADGRCLPFENESFDVAVAITVLEFAAEPEKIISEMVRCVKKSKGILIIGFLNALSKYNQKRKNRPGSIYSAAKYFSPQHTHKLLSRYGLPTIRITGFVPENKCLLSLSPLWEQLFKRLSPQTGAFIAAKVNL